MEEPWFDTPGQSTEEPRTVTRAPGPAAGQPQPHLRLDPQLRHKTSLKNPCNTHFYTKLTTSNYGASGLKKAVAHLHFREREEAILISS